ncbi:MAG: SDR family oxidoreductase [Hyphomicrobiales bacterium]|nr:SDR family oxidoreductase [Hyphomicrobiales bacterium]
MDGAKTIGEMMSLDGRVALVTGGAGHIGRRCAAALAELGARVALADLDGNGCQDAASAIHGEFGNETLALAADLADEAAVRDLPGAVAEGLGGLDIVVTCAAFVGTSRLKGWAVPFEGQSTETWRAALEVNLTSVFALVQAAAPALRKSGHGSVITLGSIYGQVGPDWGLYAGTGMGNPAAYAAGKGGLLQLTRWLATTLAPRVRVNMVSPGGIARGQDRAFVRRYLERTPLGRMGREDDVAGAVAYLAGGLAGYVTGQNIVVDGGWTAW